MRNMLVLGQIQNLLKQLTLADAAAVHKADGHTLGGTADLELIIHAAQIIGRRAFQVQHDIGLYAVGRAMGAAAADLLLHGEHKGDVAGIGFAHQFQNGVAAHAVVQRLGAHKAVAKGLIGGIEIGIGAHGALGQRFGFILRADINVQAIKAQHAVAVSGGLQVDGHRADYAGQ